MGKILLSLLTSLLLFGCTGSSVTNLVGKSEPTPSETLKKTKNEIKINTQKSKVKQLLGEPLMIKTGARGEEMWAYDRIYLGAKKHKDGRMSFLDMNGFEYVIGAGVGILISAIGINLIDVDKYKEANTYKTVLYASGAGAGIALVDYLKDGGFKSYSIKNEETLTMFISFRGDRVSNINYHYSSF